MHLTSRRGQNIIASIAALDNSQKHIGPWRRISAVLVFSMVVLSVVGVPAISQALSPLAPAEPTQLISYTASGEDFPNPERGFYIDIDLINQTNFGTLYGQGHRVAYAYVTLASYRGQDLPASFLNQLQAGLDRIRAGGLKVVPRFSYTSSGGGAESEPDASLEQTVRHIAQIGAVLGRNADIVLAVEAGFVGAWGEWHHSSNNLHVEPARSAIFDALLANMPSSRAVQFRFPRDLVLHFPTALASGNAFDGSTQARAGHHNDCFMADYHDSGTWIPEANADGLKSYIAQLNQFVAMGGETCNDAPRGDCSVARSELARFHWSYLDPNMPGSWEGCRAEFSQKLGYRFRLTQAELPNQLAPGQSFQGWLDVVNDGYAAPFNPREAELVLRNTSTGGLLILPLSTDPRRWASGSTQRVSFNLTLPSDLAAGSYEYLLNLPDPALRNRLEYRIRLANANLWEANTGFNKLSASVTVGTAGGPTPTAVVLPTATPTQVGQPTNTPVSTATARPATATAQPSAPTHTPVATNLPPTLTPIPTATTVVRTPQPNRPPVSNAGADTNGYFGWTMALNSSLSSDPDGNPLTYNWTQTGGSPIRLFSSTSSAPTFTVPITPGGLTFQLVVKDSAGLSSAVDTVVVTVINRAPLAHAGYDRVTYPGWKVYLDGARSVDPDTHRLGGYTWTQSSGIGVVLSTTSVVSPLFTAPITPGVVSFQLAVMDRFGLASLTADTVLVTVTNRAPLAHAGLDRVAVINRSVQLDGSRSADPDGHALRAYSWVQAGGAGVLLSNDSAISPTFSTPKVTGTLVFKLLVVDAFGLSSAVADTVLVTVTQPAANEPEIGDGTLDFLEVVESEVPLMPEPEVEPQGFEEIPGSDVPFEDGAVAPSGLREVYLPSLIRSPD